MKKLLLLLIPVVVLLICCIGALCFVDSSTSADTVYVQQIKAAEKYLANNDFENAVVYYNKAIEANKTEETAYLALAEIYNTRLGDLNRAIDILTLGLKNTNSQKIINLLQIYRNMLNGSTEETVADKKADTQNVINTSLLNIFGSYDYSQYRSNYTVVSENNDNGSYIVKYNNIDADFVYYNTPENQNVLNKDTLKPFDYSFPVEIKINDLNLLISGIDTGVNFSEIKTSVGVNNAVQRYDNVLKKNIITFTCGNCTLDIECDANGNITPNANFGVVKPLAKSQVNLVKVSGKVISVTDAKNVANTKIKFRKGKNVTTGNSEKEIISNDGNYSVELAPNDYTVEVSATGYNTEFFDLHISNTDSITQDFSISPALSSGEIRIVLEWGATPMDLDSHLTGTTSDGKNVAVSWMNKTCMENGQTIANLDVDDTDGYGPETITLLKTDGNFSYRVHRYSFDGSLATSEATVKVYLPSQSQPITISVPQNVTNDWNVFTIQNGQISNINGATS